MRMHNFIHLAAALVLAAVAPLAAQTGTGYLKTKVHPSRAGVFIDGKYVGPAGNFAVARKYLVAAGPHGVKLSEPRYEDLVTKIAIEPGKTVVLNESLKALPPAKPPFGKLRFEGFEKYAAVYVNGKYMGHADEFDNVEERLLLNPGEYTVKVVPVSSGAAVEQQVRLEADKTTVVRPK